MLLKKYTTLILLIFIALSTIAQENKKDLSKITKKEVLQMTIADLSDYDLDELMQIMDIIGASSLEELYELLLNKDVTSASKSAESIFDSPLSTTVLSYDEINASGATSIEEALRLVPGVIVREKTNGNYDIHIRGGQNMPMNNMFIYAENTTTLVMIDGRPVFNYGMGGTLWEALPISLGKLDRIEVVRGPASALYGPNAVNGVINLITKEITDDTPLISANFQGGSQSTYIGDFSMSKKMNDKISAGFSTSYDYRARNTNKIYALPNDKTLSLEDYHAAKVEGDWSKEDIFKMIEDPYKAKEKLGVNGYVNFIPNSNFNFNLSGGYVNSEAMRSTIGDTPTPYNVFCSNGYYANLISNIYGFNLQASVNNNKQDFTKGIKGWKQDSEQYHASLDYLIKWDNLNIRPGVSYQSVYYDDSKYIEYIGQGFINGEKSLKNYAASARLDYNPIEKIRLVAALRAEKYDVPDKIIPSYQFIASYKINENNLFRAVYSRANRSTFIVDAYSTYAWNSGGLSTFPNPENISFSGNQNLTLMNMDMLEIGFRSRPIKNLLIDIEAFYNKSNDFSALMPDSVSLALIPKQTTSIFGSYSALDLKSKQYGFSINADMVMSEKLIMKAHITYQKTIVDNFIDDNIFTVGPKLIGAAYMDIINPEIPQRAVYTAAYKVDPETYKDDVENEAIPSFWGSLSLTYKPIKKINITAQAYYYDKYNLYTMYDTDATRLSLDKLDYTGKMDGKFLLNAKVNYKLTDNIDLFINGRNILNNNKQEYIFMDTIGGLYLAGFNINF